MFLSQYASFVVLPSAVFIMTYVKFNINHIQFIQLSICCHAGLKQGRSPSWTECLQEETWLCSGHLWRLLRGVSVTVIMFGRLKNISIKIKLKINTHSSGVSFHVHQFASASLLICRCVCVIMSMSLLNWHASVQRWSAVAVPQPRRPKLSCSSSSTQQTEPVP